jgi:hypothetical protein
VVLFALWPALWLGWRWLGRRESGRQPWPRGAAQLAGVLLLGLYLLNLGYLFDGSFRPLGEFRFHSRAFRGPGDGDGPGNRFAGTWLGRLPVPLPRDYLRGIDVQKKDFESNKISYLRGEWRQGGWWYYYLYALAVKVPLGSWAVLLLALGLRLGRRGGPGPWRDELVLLAPAALVLALASWQTGINRHLRYVLPAFPLAFAWAGQAAPRALAGGWKPAALLGAALAWAGCSSLWVYPHSLAYFNELAGGPRGGHAHLLHSNIDWGQDLLFLKRWADDHPEARPLWLEQGGFLDPAHAGLDTAPPPAEPRPGWYAISVTWLHSPTKWYPRLLRFRPVATAGYSTYIYHLDSGQANELRRELGLGELPGP